MARRRVTCPYCGEDAVLVPDAAVRGFPGHGGFVYACRNWPECDAYVGVHKGTHKPLGTLADKELRGWRRQAHAWLDPLWTSGMMRRYEAYRVAAALVGVEIHECHIGSFTIEQCRALINGLSRIRLEFSRVHPNNNTNNNGGDNGD